jgi:hypothetical protein
MSKQIVVMKGVEGFADRLQVLSHLINYCKVNDAILCVDWRDDMWGQGTLDFWHYFMIKGIKCIKLENVVELVRKGAKMTPPYWNLQNLIDPPNRTIIHDRYVGPIMKTTYEKVPGEIIVTNSRGHRMYHSDNMCENICLRPEIAEIVKKRLAEYYLPCTVVHLRGTDRYEESFMGETLENLKTLPPHAKSRIYVVSDMKDLIDKWTNLVPQTQLLNKNSNILKLPFETKRGSHQHSSEVLDFYGVTKHEMNIDTITEFIGLAFATEAVGLEKSLFFQMPRFMNKEGSESIARWLGGWQPQRKSLKPAAT